MQQHATPPLYVRLILGCAATIASLSFTVQAADTINPRIVMPLDAGWRFKREDVPQAMQSGLDDKDWAKITLPYTYNGSDGDDGGGYYRGAGWYRRGITLGEAAHKENPGDPPLRAPAAGERRYLQFDGAALAADVYVNGQLAARHEGGYAGFRVDVTSLLTAGRNQIAVRVDNSKLPAIAPLGGDFTVFGGLYRRVFLLTTRDVHVDLLDHGGPGVYAATSNIQPGLSADLSLTVRVRNDRSQPARILARSTVLDADGATVAQLNSKITIPAQTTVPVVQRGGLPKPHLWNGVRDPYLYRVVTEILDARAANDRPLDQVTVPLGVRSIRIDPQRGLLLNGEPTQVYGVNLFHSGRPGRGLAVTDDEVREDMATLRELGVTGVRFVHFQHPQVAYEEADRLGFIVWTEIPLNSAIDAGKAFEANIAQQMRELIRQNFNHPSVAVWGLGNEVFAVNDDVNRVLDGVQRVAKEEDPSRPTAYAHCCQADDDPKALHSDVSAFNRYFGWYSGQEGTLGEWAAGFHRKFPQRAFALSEYGAGASIRHQQDPPERPETTGGWHPEQYQAQFHENSWRQIEKLDYVWAKFIWVAFDLASDGRAEGDRPGINDKGLITYDRAVRKDAFYWQQANWSTQPMLHLTSKRAALRTTRNVEVKVYTNVERVSLKVNGVSIGTVVTEGRIARWPAVELREGLNRIEVESTVDSTVLRDVAEWVYQSG
jgi:beta-galactosidase